MSQVFVGIQGAMRRGREFNEGLRGVSPSFWYQAGLRMFYTWLFVFCSCSFLILGGGHTQFIHMFMLSLCFQLVANIVYVYRIWTFVLMYIYIYLHNPTELAVGPLWWCFLETGGVCVFSWTTNKDNLLFRMFAPHVMNLKGACCDPVELSKAFCWAAMHPWAKWMPTDWMWSGNPEMSRLMLRHGILQVLEEGCLKKVPMEVDIFELEVGTTGEWYCWLKVLYTCITWEVLYPVHWCGLIAS